MPPFARRAEARARRGHAADLLPRIASAVGATAVVWNRRYEKEAQDEDAAIKAALRAAGMEARSFNSHLLHEPWEVVGKTARRSRCSRRSGGRRESAASRRLQPLRPTG